FPGGTYYKLQDGRIHDDNHVSGPYYVVGKGSGIITQFDVQSIIDAVKSGREIKEASLDFTDRWIADPKVFSTDVSVYGFEGTANGRFSLTGQDEFNNIPQSKNPSFFTAYDTTSRLAGSVAKGENQDVEKTSVKITEYLREYVSSPP